MVVAYASLGETFTIRGLALGEGPVRAFESRLERGFLRVSEFLMAKQGACHRFEARGKSPVAGPDAELPVPVEDPFEQDPQPCRVDRDAARALVVRGRTPTPKEPGHGPLTLRLRDVDLADVFQVLAALGASGFVVDGDVAGRVSVEVTRATLDETLAAIRKASGLEIAAAGPVRRVGASHPAAAKPARRRPVRRRASRSSAPRCATCSPRWPRSTPRSRRSGRRASWASVSVWTQDAPLQAVRAAVLESAGLSERIEEDRRVLQGRTGTLDAPVPVARADDEPRLSLRREELSVLEFQLAGVAPTATPSSRSPTRRPASSTPIAPAIASPTARSAPSTRPTCCWRRTKARCGSRCRPRPTRAAHPQTKRPGSRSSRVNWAYCPAHLMVRFTFSLNRGPCGPSTARWSAVSFRHAFLRVSGSSRRRIETPRASSRSSLPSEIASAASTSVECFGRIALSA